MSTRNRLLFCWIVVVSTAACSTSSTGTTLPGNGTDAGSTVDSGTAPTAPARSGQPLSSALIIQFCGLAVNTCNNPMGYSNINECEATIGAYLLPTACAGAVQDLITSKSCTDLTSATSAYHKACYPACPATLAPGANVCTSDSTALEGCGTDSTILVLDCAQTCTGMAKQWNSTQGCNGTTCAVMGTKGDSQPYCCCQ